MTEPAFQELVPNLVWVRDAALDFLGLPLGTRMTVVRLAGGDLFVHSPVALADEIRHQIDALGRVRYVVAPNRLHHLYIGPWADAFPGAALYGTPALRRKRNDVRWSGTLSDDVPMPWSAEIRQLRFAGNIYLDEFVFCHEAAGVLIVTDLIQRHDRLTTPLQRAIGRVLGVKDRHGVPLDLRLTFWNRSATRAALATLLAWEFDVLVLAHGPVVRTGGRAVVERAMQWLAGRA